MSPPFADSGLNVPIDHHGFEMMMPRPVMADEPDQFVVAVLQIVELPVQVIDSPLDIASAHLALAQRQPSACASLTESMYQRCAPLQLCPKLDRLLAVENKSRPELSAQTRPEIPKCSGNARYQ